jgi:ech hydrogenase subunit F
MFMLNTVLRNLANKPATRNYPFEPSHTFPKMRGRLFIHVDKCIFCRLCQMRCPAQCIHSDPQRAIWSYDPFECVNCGICMEVCPSNCLFMDNKPRIPSPLKFCRHVQGVQRHKAVERAKRKPDLFVADDKVEIDIAAELQEAPVETNNE